LEKIEEFFSPYELLDQIADNEDDQEGQEKLKQ